MLLSLRWKGRRYRTETGMVLAALLLAVSFPAALLSALQIPYRLSEAFSGSLAGGLTAVWNHAAEVLGNASYVILPLYQGKGQSCGLFLTLTFFVLLAVAWLVVRSRVTPLLLLFALPPALLFLFFPLQPAPGFVVLLAAALLFAWILMRNPDGLVKALVCAALPALCAVLLMLGLGTDSPMLRGSASGTTAAGERAADLLYGTDDLGHGDLTKRERRIREGEALSVSMQTPQSMYLKGFTGAQLKENQWMELSPADYYAAKPQMDALEEAGFYAPGGLSQAAELAYGPLASNEITVKNTGADRRMVYVPYDIKESQTLDAFRKRGGTEFAAPRLTGASSYTYTASENQVDNWSDAAARFMTLALGSSAEGMAARSQLALERHLNHFVYDAYTRLTTAERKLLAENIGSRGDQSKGHMDYKVAIDSIRHFLEENFIYTEDLGGMASGTQGALEEFFTSHKGFDVQFATAATLMFRYYGIPARYAEGYLITPEDVKGAEPGVPISVERERAHAWTELYIDGVGFVPLEVTPEFYGQMEEADLSVGISNQSLVREFEELYGGESTGDEAEEPEQREQEGDSFRTVLLSVLCVLAGLLVLAGLFLLLRRFLPWVFVAFARRRLFWRGEPKQAVAAVYGYMEEQGLQPDGAVKQLGNLAAYSPHPVTEEDRRFMLDSYKRIKKETKRKGAGRG